MKKNVLVYCKVPIFRIHSFIFFSFFFNLCRISDWSMPKETEKFSTFELWAVMKSLFMQTRNSKENVWIHDANTGWQMAIIFNSEEVVCQFPSWRFWNPSCSTSWKAFNDVNSWNWWSCLSRNFGRSTNLNQKNCWDIKDIQETPCDYNSWAVGYAETVSETDAKMSECRPQTITSGHTFAVEFAVYSAI